MQESKFFESCVPELIESRIGALRNVEKPKRAASAAQLAIGLRERLGPLYLDRIIDKIDIPDESDLLFLLHQEKNYVAAVVLAQAKRKDLIEAAGKALGAHEWNHEFDGINHFLNGVRKSFAGNERMICRCYAGLWEWYSKQEKNTMLALDFALELLLALKPEKGFVKISVVMSMLESACLGPQWEKSPRLAGGAARDREGPSRAKRESGRIGCSMDSPSRSVIAATSGL